ncbi:MAG: hypothetical protein RL748_2960 [Pseudomonadota bacterium]
MSLRKRATWYAHVGAVRTTPLMAAWLSDRGSLTAKLIAHSQQFRVQCLHQWQAPCLSDEMQVLGLGSAVSGARRRVIEREVLLRCNEQPVVFAHTAVPLSCTASDWPLFKTLGNRSLGTTLFDDPQVLRGQLQYARLRHGHPLARRASLATGMNLPPQLLARRSLFWRKRGMLLVTEVFLPTLDSLLQTQLPQPTYP